MRSILFVLVIELFIMTTLQKQDFSMYFPKVILFGDSLTQKGFHDGGWCIKLMENFERKSDFLNRGFSGYTSRMLRVVLPKLLHYDGKPKGSLYAATILLGTNDAVLEEKDDRHVPIKEYKENLQKIVSLMEGSGIQTENIILISPPPIDLKAWETHCSIQGCLPVSHSEEQLFSYVNASLSLANELNIRSIDLWKGMLEQKNWRDFFSDGLHFSKQGHEFIYQRVKEHFDVILSPLMSVYPNWKNVNHVNPETDLAATG